MSSLREISRGLGAAVKSGLSSVVSVQSGACGSASGVIWGDGHVVTSASRLGREEGLDLIVGGERRTGRVLGVDPASDLAVVHVDGELAAAPVRREDPELELGELVLALGRASGPVARLGIVSRLGGEWRLSGGSRFNRYIESDIVVSGGLAGGPLLDASGALIGVNSVSVARGRLVTLPADGVAGIVDAIRAHGRVRRARLGVSVQRVELPARAADELGRRFGLIVLGVQSGSGADQAGVTLGDVLVQLGAASLQRVEDLQSALEAGLIDTAVPLEIVRAGKRQTLNVVPSS